MDVPQSPEEAEIKQEGSASKPKQRSRIRKTPGEGSDETSKRRIVVSSACVACRKRKSKCDGAPNGCAACKNVYFTPCVYEPGSDHRRKGVYKTDTDHNLKTRNSTLEVIIQAILNLPEEEVPELVRQIRTCESLDSVAEDLLAKEAGLEREDENLEVDVSNVGGGPTFEGQLSGSLGELRLEDGSTRYIGGTSNLLFLGNGDEDRSTLTAQTTELYSDQKFTEVSWTDVTNDEQTHNAVISWTNVTDNADLIQHLLRLYFTYHYAYFTTLSKKSFFKDFLRGRQQQPSRACSSLLVNAMLALGCHFTAWPGARADPDDSATAGDHFFQEAKRLIMANDEHEKPRLTTVQALALMSVREAGCGREAKGWVYSGMSFRMACDLGLNLDAGTLPGSRDSQLNEDEVDCRRITFWGVFQFDKCWSNYLGRMPQLPPSIVAIPKFDVFPGEESEIWAAYTDFGFNQSHAQPSRTRTIALQMTTLCAISSDLLTYFYNPIEIDKAKNKQAELKKLSDIHQRLESWRRDLPVELEIRESSLPHLLLMHMFFQLLYIHTFRPFLKYSRESSPLPPNVSPRRLCTQAAASISKLIRLYKRSHGLRQICNIAVYITHSACTIHLLNLPDKNAKRDIVHGVKHLEEIAESWLCARRSLSILGMLSQKWKVELPDEATSVFARSREKFGVWNGETHVKEKHTPSPRPSITNALYANQDGQLMMSSTSGPDMRSMVPSISSIPPHSGVELQQPRLPPQSSSAATPPPAATWSPYDSNITQAGASPSGLFGGVDQLLRDSQDWWLRDQSQLAMGFEQWPITESEISSWMAATSTNPATAGSTFVTNNGLDGINGFSALNSYPEHEWYL